MCYRNWLISLVVCVQVLCASAQTTCGTVVSEDGPLAFARVFSAELKMSVWTDSLGTFCWKGAMLPADVRIDATGQQKPLTPTIERTSDGHWKLTVEASAIALKEVAVEDRAAAVQHSTNGAATTIYNARFFQSTRASSIADILQAVPGLQPQVNCAVCATTDIQLNGLPGPYTLVLINGMPVVSGLSTVYGFAAIPSAMIDRVEVTRGPAGAQYGSEAMAGMINIVLRSDTTATKRPSIYYDVGSSNWGEHTADVAAMYRLGKWQSITSVSTKWLQKRTDQNQDGFTDLPLQKRLAAMQQWSRRHSGNRSTNMTVRWMNEDRWGGQMQWTPIHRGSDVLYGESIRTQRMEALLDHTLPLPTHVVFQHSTVFHRQDAWYGNTPFGAHQWIHFSQLMWKAHLRENIEFTSGVAQRSEYYDDNTVATAAKDGGKMAWWRTTWSVYSQSTWKWRRNISFEPGIRMDVHPVHGLIPSPRVFLRWQSKHQRTWKAGLAKGFRTVSIFTEDHAALTGSRQVIMAEALQPETSLSGVAQYDGAHTFAGCDVDVECTAFYTHFYNRIVADYLSDANAIIYRNLHGRGASRGVVFNAAITTSKPISLNIGAMYNQVYLEDDGVRRPMLFAPKVSGTFQVNARLRRGFTCSTSGEWRGPMHLPVQQMDPRSAMSPTYLLWHLQLKKSFPKGHAIVIGMRNLLDFTPQQPILRAFDPFDRSVNDASNPQGHTFDTTYSYASMQGRSIFIAVSGKF